jgi:hypothetical protein
MSAETRRPRPETRVWVCKTGFMAATLAAALGCIMAAVPPAAAELQAANLWGRWTQVVAGTKQPLTYDLVRCGEVWCGIEVRNGKDCGHTAIRLDAGAAHEHDVEFFGRYEKAQGTAPYMVSAVLHLASQKDQPNAQLQLSVRGNTGGTFEAFRRTFPFYMVLKRDGEPACRADPKLS